MSWSTGGRPTYMYRGAVVRCTYWTSDDGENGAQRLHPVNIASANILACDAILQIWCINKIDEKVVGTLNTALILRLLFDAALYQTKSYALGEAVCLGKTCNWTSGSYKPYAVGASLSEWNECYEVTKGTFTLLNFLGKILAKKIPASWHHVSAKIEEWFITSSIFFLESFFVFWCLDNLEELQNTSCWLVYFCIFYFPIACAWSLQRLETLGPGRQFLPSRLVYGTKIGQSVAWLLQRLETPNWRQYKEFVLFFY